MTANTNSNLERLERLERLVGTWTVSGGATGTVRAR